MVAIAGCSETSGATPSGGGGASESGGSSNSGGATTTGSGGSTSAPTGGVGASAGTTATGPGLWATINVQLVPEEGVAAAHTSLEAFAKDSAPAPDLFSATKTVGDCKLLEPTYVLCDAPKCASTETCVAQNKCMTSQVAVTMGSPKFTGLELQAGGTEFTLAPTKTGGTVYIAAGDTAVAYPPCTVGKDVSVSGGADAATTFSVKTPCIETLVVTSTAPVPFEPNKPVQLTWTKATGGTSRVSIRFDISHHGGLKGLILCDAADTGSLQVDATLVTGLIGLGTAGLPVVKLTRLSTASAAAGSGVATLNILSAIELPLQVPGVVSCTGDTECQTGQTCTAMKCQ